MVLIFALNVTRKTYYYAKSFKLGINNTMKGLLFAFVVAATCGLTSCSKILDASFEDDDTDSPPATDLPGSPAGDVIEFHASLQPQLKVQNDDISGSKALHFTNFSGTLPPVSQRRLSFKGIGTDLTETLWFTHTGQNMGSEMSIDVSDGHGHSMVRMHIRFDGQVGLATNLADPYTDVIGNVGSGKHTIIFTTFPSTLKYNVSIIKESAPAIIAENRPMITDNPLSFNNPAHPTLHFMHYSLTTGVGLGTTYAIGSVSISKREP
jgi:hypothetical protein